jgi:serine/threonine protein kinase
VIYRCVVGSRAFGLAGDGSDTDRRGIYLPPADLQWSRYGARELLKNEATQECYWELQKFLILSLKATPNILECLYTPLVETATPIAQELLATREFFLSKLVYQTYNGYVMSQFKKLEWEDCRKRAHMIGKIIGNYQITGELAQGGMGAVYRGRHLYLPREVVVKSILVGAFPQSAQAELRVRFRREAFVQSQLDHPNIVRIYEFFAAEENYYLVMEYVAGMSLRDLLARQGAPAPAQAVYLLKQALSALDYAHNFSYLYESERRHTGVIHRDIKPANILLDTEGRLKITDFGIVKVMGEQTGSLMTQAGFHPGTVEYMSPEQLLGREIDVRADIYSLGVTFYEIITGRLPFLRSETGSDWEIRKGHIELDPPPILEIRAEVHPQLAEIMMRSLRKNPDERYQSATTFLEALRDYEQNHAEKEQTLRSPLARLTQPLSMKPTLQAILPTSIDASATLLARQARDESAGSGKAQHEDDLSNLMKPEDVSPGFPASTASQVPAGAKIASLSQHDKSGRKWPLAVGGAGLLLAGTVAGVILFLREKPPERALQPVMAKVETPSPTLTPISAPTSAPAAAAASSPVARNATKPKPPATPAPAQGEQMPFIQALNLERQERYDEAIKVYESYLVRNPNAPASKIAASYLDRVRKMLDILTAADSAMKNRLYLAAKTQYMKALTLRPNSNRAKQGLAAADMNMKMKSAPPPGTRR